MAFVETEGVLRSPLLSGLHWLDHGFGTGPAGDWLDGRPTATLSQVHSDTVVDAAGRIGRLCEGDSIINSVPDSWIAVRTADCVPVILADTRRRVVAAVHSGWRGTAASIIAKTVERLRADFSSDVKDLHAAIGPAVGGCCYRVGPEVLERLAAWNDRSDGRVALDRIVALQLAQAGVPAVDECGICTCCGGSRFESFRRDGARAGRMVSAAMILGGKNDDGAEPKLRAALFRRSRRR
jgi:YfiH family protein